MIEGLDSLTFPMRRESDSASRLKAIISDMLPLVYDDNTEDVLSEYITMVVCNGKSQRQAREVLETFLGDQTGEFVACLWEILLKDFSQNEQENSASEPTTAVEFGSHDTVVEQGLSSREHNDYDDKATYSMNENLLPVTAPIEDVEAHVSPKAKNMEMLRQDLNNSPCKRAQSEEKDDWNLSGVNYSRKPLRSVVLSARMQPCGMNPNKYEKYIDERSGNLQERPYLPEREMGESYSQSVSSGESLSERSDDTASHQELKPRVSVWDRLGRTRSNLDYDRECPTLPRFGILADENEVLQQNGHGPALPATYSEQYSNTFLREVPADGYRHGAFQSHKALRPESEAITSTKPHITYNFNRKRRYSVTNPNSGDDFTSALQYKQAKEDVGKPSLLSYQSAKPDIHTEILKMKQKLQQLETQIKQAKQLKKQKVGELKHSPPQSGKLKYQQDATESRIIHVTNVHYAARKKDISLLFSKCGAIKNVIIVTDPVTRRPKGAAFVTFATKESVDKALELNNTMFYSRPIKVWRHVVMSQTPPVPPQVVSGS